MGTKLLTMQRAVSQSQAAGSFDKESFEKERGRLDAQVGGKASALFLIQ